VGATAVKKVRGVLKEVVADSHLGVGITSGGGFSTRYERPLYQAQVGGVEWGGIEWNGMGGWMGGSVNECTR
jgi:hypothetical protein